jgi:hypothetical protein
MHLCYAGTATYRADGQRAQCNAISSKQALDNLTAKGDRQPRWASGSGPIFGGAPAAGRLLGAPEESVEALGAASLNLVGVRANLERRARRGHNHVNGVVFSISRSCRWRAASISCDLAPTKRSIGDTLRPHRPRQASLHHEGKPNGHGRTRA